MASNLRVQKLLIDIKGRPRRQGRGYLFRAEIWRLMTIGCILLQMQRVTAKTDKKTGEYILNIMKEEGVALNDIVGYDVFYNKPEYYLVQ